ncbi:HNH endonuclease signature motif containing protein [Sphingorhabdus sp. SMR4y]|uniref:HNH endonuclease signature motif containing protein n=1 Tax=Sphingorhabdus sp. SMR4y TaxID=2584094 RepID=UPI000B5C8625|nr:HNH endonuclease signature motif containing protein [Sphingorhabdus sp. SMR4y]ASK88496.1 HNH endonuclease [Sphingorhabdus sp. SMR4y]
MGKAREQMQRQRDESERLLEWNRAATIRQLQADFEKPESLARLMEYNPDSGALKWRARMPEMFAVKYRQPEAQCAAWNTRWAGKPALNCQDKSGYRHGRVNRKKVYAHRAAWEIFHGSPPENQIDHINGVRNDNRIANLRDVTCSQNLQNAKLRTSNSSGCTGVSFNGQLQKWETYIIVDSKQIRLGMFADFDDAVAARKKAERVHGFHPNHGRSEQDLRAAGMSWEQVWDAKNAEFFDPEIFRSIQQETEA